jgi:hypothetical protein
MAEFKVKSYRMSSAFDTVLRMAWVYAEADGKTRSESVSSRNLNEELTAEPRLSSHSAFASEEQIVYRPTYLSKRSNALLV